MATEGMQGASRLLLKQLHELIICMCVPEACHEASDASDRELRKFTMESKQHNGHETKVCRRCAECRPKGGPRDIGRFAV